MRYTIYDHLLGKSLDPARNWGEDIIKDGQHTGWQVMMTDAAGLTGERMAIGISEIAPGWEEEEDLTMVKFSVGRLYADIYHAELSLPGAGVGAPIGIAVGAGVGHKRKEAGLIAVLGGAIGALAGWFVGKTIRTPWRVRYHA